MIIKKIGTEEDFENWAYECGQSTAYSDKAQVSESFALLVRKRIRDMLLERKRKPTIDLIYEKILQVTAKKFEVLNLLDGPDIPIPDSRVDLVKIYSL